MLCILWSYRLLSFHKYIKKFTLSYFLNRPFVSRMLSSRRESRPDQFQAWDSSLWTSVPQWPEFHLQPSLHHTRNCVKLFLAHPIVLSMGNKPPPKNILRKVLSNGPSENLRPLYNSNVAKVSIVKWSQILISTVRSSIFDIPKIFKKSRFQCIFKKMV